MFPDGQREGLYHTADATLWFFHAIERYTRRTGDDETLRKLLPVLHRHRRSTTCAARASASASIRRTACSRRGREGYQLTWMDAKVDDWVVTPRRGKAVEMNALWYNALCLMQSWTQQYGGGEGLEPRRARARARASRSTSASGTSRAAISTTSSTASTATIRRCRPNQVFAISLPHPVLDRERWEPVMNVVRERLLTPVGLRSLAPGETRLQGALLRRPARARRRLPPGHRVGLADRPVHRRGAEAARRRSIAGCATLLAGFDQRLERGLRRPDQRSVRRRAAVPAARLRRAGLERRGSAALLAARCRTRCRVEAASWHCTLDRDARRSRLDAAVRGGVRAVPRRGVSPGARLPRAHAHLPRDGGRRASSSRACRGGCATTPRAAPIFPPSATGSSSKPRRRRRRAHPRRPAARHALLAPRRRQSDRGAGRRRQHRRRVPRLGARSRFQSAPHRALSRHRVGERRRAGHRPEQGGSRRRSRGVRRGGRRARRRACRCTPCRRSARSRWRRCASISAAGGRRRCSDRRAWGSRRSPTRSSARSVLRTREVRESDSRGRHTTTGRQLVLLPGGGILIDTPGMRELQLWDTGEAVAGAFADIESIGEGCRFRDCRHAGEPGCAVVAAVAAGMLPAARLESYPQAAGGAGVPGDAAGRARAARSEAPLEGAHQGRGEAHQGEGALRSAGCWVLGARCSVLGAGC